MSDADADPVPLAGGTRGAQPPWIVGLRGAPREAPENTLLSLERALARGLAGVAYEVRRAASGELFLLADATLERTTDREGALAERTLPELSEADAGGWFGARFRGEPLPTLPEVLARARADAREPLQLVLVPEPAASAELAAAVREAGLARRVRVAARARTSCVELRDEGLECLLWLDELDEEARRFVADERLAGVLAPMRAWRGPLGAESWRGERWVHAADEPEDLLDALRMPAFGLSTTEPERARAARVLHALLEAQAAREGAGARPAWPLVAPQLECEPGVRGVDGLLRPDWSGRWSTHARLHNPFGFELRVELGLVVRRGAFEIEGLPTAFALAPGESAEPAFRISGGSRSPGGDPLLLARLAWRAGPGRPAGALVLDATLHRVRGAVADRQARRLTLLREAPRQRDASLTLRRRGSELLVGVEDAGGLADARVLVRLDARLQRGARALRIALPADFDRRPGGVEFSCGFEGRAPARAGATRGELVLRRWAGGLPDPIHDGAPGRLVPLARA